MPDRSQLALERTDGVRLDLSDYRRDFRRRRAELMGVDSWKFERRQHFEEPGDPSWEPFSQGLWEEAMRALDAERAEFAEEAREDAANAHRFHRVRVIREPLTPYLQWELRALRVQAELGKRIRVVPDEAVRHLEDDSPLPEVVVLGAETLYEVCYTEAGVLDGGVRHTDPGIIQHWTKFIVDLYAEGEDLIAYADRYLNHLPPPQPEAR